MNVQHPPAMHIQGIAGRSNVQRRTSNNDVAPLLNLNRKDRATCRVVAEGEAGSDTTNLQSSIFNSTPPADLGWVFDAQPTMNFS